MDLSAYGFTHVGEWITQPRIKSGIAFNLDTCAKDRVVYAFVVNSQPKYIGVCDKDTTTLQDRMKRYKSQQGGSTNKRIAANIKQSLERGETVQIFAANPSPKYEYVDLRVDLIKGLENPLIAMFRPEWNR